MHTFDQYLLLLLIMFLCISGQFCDKASLFLLTTKIDSVMIIVVCRRSTPLACTTLHIANYGCQLFGTAIVDYKQSISSIDIRTVVIDQQ